MTDQPPPPMPPNVPSGPPPGSPSMPPGPPPTPYGPPPAYGASAPGAYGPPPAHGASASNPYGPPAGSFPPAPGTLPPAGAQFPPPGKPTSRRPLRIGLIFLGVVLLLCCLGGITGGFLLFNKAKEAVQPPRDATSAFYDRLVAADYPGAYDLLCGWVKGRTSREDFVRTQTAEPRITDFKITGTSVTNRNGSVSGTVTVEVRKATGGTNTELVPLVKEDGEWRVCRGAVG